MPLPGSCHAMSPRCSVTDRTKPLPSNCFLLIQIEVQLTCYAHFSGYAMVTALHLLRRNLSNTYKTHILSITQAPNQPDRIPSRFPPPLCTAIPSHVPSPLAGQTA